MVVAEIVASRQPNRRGEVAAVLRLKVAKNSDYQSQLEPKPLASWLSNLSKES